jgi:hypothetical protein
MDIALPFPVRLGSVTHTDGSSTRMWAYDQRNPKEWVEYTVNPVHERVSVGTFLSMGPTNTYGYYDFIQFGGQSNTTLQIQSCVAQLKDNPNPSQRVLRAHSTPSSGTAYGEGIPVLPDTFYWVTVQYDSGNNRCSVAVFDPNTWQQVGPTSISPLDPAIQVRRFRFGSNSHNLSTESYSYFDDILIDWTEGKFPLGIDK